MIAKQWHYIEDLLVVPTDPLNAPVHVGVEINTTDSWPTSLYTAYTETESDEFEYFYADEWLEYPVEGLESTYYGCPVRHKIHDPELMGTYYIRAWDSVNEYDTAVELILTPSLLRHVEVWDREYTQTELNSYYCPNDEQEDVTEYVCPSYRDSTVFYSETKCPDCGTTLVSEDIEPDVRPIVATEGEFLSTRTADPSGVVKFFVSPEYQNLCNIWNYSISYSETKPSGTFNPGVLVELENPYTQVHTLNCSGVKGYYTVYVEASGIRCNRDNAAKCVLGYGYDISEKPDNALDPQWLSEPQNYQGGYWVTSSGVLSRGVCANESCSGYLSIPAVSDTYTIFYDPDEIRWSVFDLGGGLDSRYALVCNNAEVVQNTILWNQIIDERIADASGYLATDPVKRNTVVAELTSQRTRYDDVQHLVGHFFCSHYRDNVPVFPEHKMCSNSNTKFFQTITSVTPNVDEYAYVCSGYSRITGFRFAINTSGYQEGTADILKPTPVLYDITDPTSTCQKLLSDYKGDGLTIQTDEVCGFPLVPTTFVSGRVWYKECPECGEPLVPFVSQNRVLRVKRCPNNTQTERQRYVCSNYANREPFETPTVCNICGEDLTYVVPKEVFHLEQYHRDYTLTTMDKAKLKRGKTYYWSHCMWFTEEDRRPTELAYALSGELEYAQWGEVQSFVYDNVHPEADTYSEYVDSLTAEISALETELELVDSREDKLLERSFRRLQNEPYEYFQGYSWAGDSVTIPLSSHDYINGYGDVTPTPSGVLLRQRYETVVSNAYSFVDTTYNIGSGNWQIIYEATAVPSGEYRFTSEFERIDYANNDSSCSRGLYWSISLDIESDNKIYASYYNGSTTNTIDLGLELIEESFVVRLAKLGDNLTVRVDFAEDNADYTFTGGTGKTGWRPRVYCSSGECFITILQVTMPEKPELTDDWLSSLQVRGSTGDLSKIESENNYSFNVWSPTYYAIEIDPAPTFDSVNGSPFKVIKYNGWSCLNSQPVYYYNANEDSYTAHLCGQYGIVKTELEAASVNFVCSECSHVLTHNRIGGETDAFNGDVPNEGFLAVLKANYPGLDNADLLCQDLDGDGLPDFEILDRQFIQKPFFDFENHDIVRDSDWRTFNQINHIGKGSYTRLDANVNGSIELKNAQVAKLYTEQINCPVTDDFYPRYYNVLDSQIEVLPLDTETRIGDNPAFYTSMARQTIDTSSFTSDDWFAFTDFRYCVQLPETYCYPSPIFEYNPTNTSVADSHRVVLVSVALRTATNEVVGSINYIPFSSKVAHHKRIGSDTDTIKAVHSFDTNIRSGRGFVLNIDHSGYVTPREWSAVKVNLYADMIKVLGVNISEVKSIQINVGTQIYRCQVRSWSSTESGRNVVRAFFRYVIIGHTGQVDDTKPDKVLYDHTSFDGNYYYRIMPYNVGLNPRYGNTADELNLKFFAVDNKSTTYLVGENVDKLRVNSVGNVAPWTFGQKYVYKRGEYTRPKPLKYDSSIVGIFENTEVI